MFISHSIGTLNFLILDNYYVVFYTQDNETPVFHLFNDFDTATVQFQKKSEEMYKLKIDESVSRIHHLLNK